jgi:hypothetical protein
VSANSRSGSGKNCATEQQPPAMFVQQPLQAPRFRARIEIAVRAVIAWNRRE